MSAAIQFGEFQADLHAREVRRLGVRVPLQAQPFEVLLALLQRPGQLISRETLQKQIWPDIAFIDAEGGLNKAVNRLREVLGDRSRKPQFIETLPKRGYRWIAPVNYDIRSLAVLPLADHSVDPTRVEWADSITEELINAISCITPLDVISRTSAMRFKNSPHQIGEIARHLNADAVLVGSVAVSERRIAVHLRLLEAFSERLLWSDACEGDLDEMVALQHQIASKLAIELRTRIANAGNGPSFPVKRIDPNAYEACMKGRLFWGRRTETDLEKSIEYFNRAATIDPMYPESYLGMADAQIMLGIFGLRKSCEVFPNARLAAEKALQIDRHLSGAHTSLGTILSMYLWEPAAAEEQFRRALKLNPSSSIAHQWYGAHLNAMGRNEEAIASVLRARTLDPLSVVINAFLGLTYYKARQFSAGVEAAKEAVELDPNNPFAHYILSRVLCGKGEYNAAVSQAEIACSLSHNRLPFSAHAGYAYGRAGLHTEAVGVLSRLHELRHSRYVSPYEIAVIYLALNERDSAAEWLEIALDERAAKLTEILDPIFDPLRGCELFSRIVSELHIADSRDRKSCVPT